MLLELKVIHIELKTQVRQPVTLLVWSFTLVTTHKERRKEKTQHSSTRRLELVLPRSHDSIAYHSSSSSIPSMYFRTIIGFGKGHLEVNKEANHCLRLQTLQLIPILHVQYTMR